MCNTEEISYMIYRHIGAKNGYSCLISSSAPPEHRHVKTKRDMDLIMSESICEPIHTTKPTWQIHMSARWWNSKVLLSNFLSPCYTSEQHGFRKRLMGSKFRRVFLEPLGRSSWSVRCCKVLMDLPKPAVMYNSNKYSTYIPQNLHFRMLCKALLKHNWPVKILFSSEMK